MTIEQLIEKIIPFTEPLLKDKSNNDISNLKSFYDSFPNLNVFYRIVSLNISTCIAKISFK